jgi:hypothetical protein
MARPLRGIIQDYETGEFIEFFTFSDPQKSRSANYDDVAVRGRSEPHDFYSSTDAQDWSLTIYLIASIEQNDEGSVISVRKKENFLESLLMPDYGDNPAEDASVVKPPHYARIRIGRMFNVIGSVRNLSFNYPRPYSANGLPQQIEVSISFRSKRTIKPLGYAATRELSLADRGE